MKKSSGEAALNKDIYFMTLVVYKKIENILGIPIQKQATMNGQQIRTLCKNARIKLNYKPRKSSAEKIALNLCELMGSDGLFGTINIKDFHSNRANIYRHKYVNQVKKQLKKLFLLNPGYAKLEVGIDGNFHIHLIFRSDMDLRNMPATWEIAYAEPVYSYLKSVRYFKKCGDARLTKKHEKKLNAVWSGEALWLSESLKNQLSGKRNPDLNFCFNLSPPVTGVTQTKQPIPHTQFSTEQGTKMTKDTLADEPYDTRFFTGTQAELSFEKFLKPYGGTRNTNPKGSWKKYDVSWNFADRFNTPKWVKLTENMTKTFELKSDNGGTNNVIISIHKCTEPDTENYLPWLSKYCLNYGVGRTKADYYVTLDRTENMFYIAETDRLLDLIRNHQFKDVQVKLENNPVTVYGRSLLIPKQIWNNNFQKEIAMDVV